LPKTVRFAKFVLAGMLAGNEFGTWAGVHPSLERLRAVVQAFVAFFEHRSHHAAISPPGGVVVNLCSGSRGPDEDLQGVGTVLAVEGMGHVPAFVPSRFLQEGKDIGIKEGGILCQTGQEGDGSLQGQLRGKVGELLELVGIQRGECGPHLLAFLAKDVAR